MALDGTSGSPRWSSGSSPGLRNFIRRRVPDPRDAEDILQEVLYELVERIAC